MSLQQCSHILEICLAQDPSQMFDIMHLTASDAPPAGCPQSGQPSWCACTNSREMSSDASVVGNNSSTASPDSPIWRPIFYKRGYYA
ncbi:Translation initiation factor IF-2 [Labeo rohita]|uniref:Translation initiation factor IF-2 n=1 Tax=Labeo rohita TaxID=84645 RepID=A0ABQ8L2F2_LABRO|nr:Translation initiation factor IF-2 [Labeo rohita]